MISDSLGEAHIYEQPAAELALGWGGTQRVKTACPSPEMAAKSSGGSEEDGGRRGDICPAWPPASGNARVCVCGHRAASGIARACVCGHRRAGSCACVYTHFRRAPIHLPTRGPRGSDLIGECVFFFGSARECVGMRCFGLRSTTCASSRTDPCSSATSVACTSQVLVYPLGGTSYWGHPLGEPNAPPAPMQLPCSLLHPGSHSFALVVHMPSVQVHVHLLLVRVVVQRARTFHHHSPCSAYSAVSS
jgi:hypothetical protein